MLARSWPRRKCSSAGGSWSSSEGAASRATCRAGRDGSCSRTSSRTATGRRRARRCSRRCGRTDETAGSRRSSRRCAASSPLDGLRPDVPELWVDIEAAAAAVHRAESALALGQPHEAWGPSQVAMFVAGRPFLAGEEAPWIDEERRSLSALHVRALEAYAAATVGVGGTELAAAVRAARRLRRARAVPRDGLPDPDGRARPRGKHRRGAARLRLAALPAARRPGRHAVSGDAGPPPRLLR